MEIKQMDAAEIQFNTDLQDRFTAKLNNTMFTAAQSIPFEWFRYANIALMHTSPRQVGVKPTEFKVLRDITRGGEMTFMQFAHLNNALENLTLAQAKETLPAALQGDASTVIKYDDVMQICEAYADIWNDAVAGMRTEVEAEMMEAAQNKIVNKLKPVAE